MKPEPLKNKLKLRSIPAVLTATDLEIKSATEWLKLELSKMFVGESENTKFENRIKKKVDKAFEDVTKDD